MPGNVKASTDVMPPIDNYPHKKMWQSVVLFVVVYGFYERVQMNGKELENKTICNYELVLTTFLDKKG